ncbi:hypothetical protein [Siminovitchia sp. 179-K 8D1 HS]|uniref:hypothetical protein n=1 Tax=Siminovitchia sp. 179-K 8D1 HS TaxID=3142385 RepID=UPI0039A138E0
MIIINHPDADHFIEYKLEVERMIYEGGGVFEELPIRTDALYDSRKPENASG